MTSGSFSGFSGITLHKRRPTDMQFQGQKDRIDGPIGWSVLVVDAHGLHELSIVIETSFG